MPNPLTKLFLTAFSLSLSLSLSLSAPSVLANQLPPDISLPSDFSAPTVNTNVSLSPLEGWNINIGAPVVIGSQVGMPSLGICANRDFALGQALKWPGIASGISMGLSAQAFMPLDFQQLYLGASLGLGHSIAIGGNFLDYGLRYAPLVSTDWKSNNTGYHGVLANVGWHMKIAPNTWSSFGVQGGFYSPFTSSGEPIWVLQPLIGLNISL